jgi:hypothetical protein
MAVITLSDMSVIIAGEVKKPDFFGKGRCILTRKIRLFSPMNNVHLT